MSIKLLLLLLFSMYIDLSIACSRETKTPILKAVPAQNKSERNDKNKQTPNKSDKNENTTPSKIADSPTPKLSHVSSVNERLFGLVTCTSKADFAKNKGTSTSEEYAGKKKSTRTGTGTATGTVTESSSPHRRKSFGSSREMICNDCQANKDSLLPRLWIGESFGRAVDTPNSSITKKGETDTRPTPSKNSLTDILKRTFGKTPSFRRNSNEKESNALIDEGGQNTKLSNVGTKKKDKAAEINSSRNKDKAEEGNSLRNGELRVTKTVVGTAEIRPSSSSARTNDEVRKSSGPKQIISNVDNSRRMKNLQKMKGNSETADSWVDTSGPVIRRNIAASDTKSEGFGYNLDGELTSQSLLSPSTSSFSSMYFETANHVDTSKCDKRQLRLWEETDLYLSNLKNCGSLISKGFEASQRTMRLFSQRPQSLSKVLLNEKEKKEEVDLLDMICREIVDDFKLEVPNHGRNFEFFFYRGEVVENVKIGRKINQKAVVLGDCLLMHETLTIIVGSTNKESVANNVRYYFVAITDEHSQCYIVKDYFKKSTNKGKKCEFSHKQKYALCPAVCE